MACFQSPFESELHVQHVLELLKKKDAKAAVSYLKSNVGPDDFGERGFGGRHLMYCLRSGDFVYSSDSSSISFGIYEVLVAGVLRSSLQWMSASAILPSVGWLAGQWCADRGGVTVAADCSSWRRFFSRPRASSRFFCLALLPVRVVRRILEFWSKGHGRLASPVHSAVALC